MIQSYERWIPLPDGILNLLWTERAKKKWIQYYLERNYSGWKPIDWNEQKETVLVRWEGDANGKPTAR